MAESAAPSPGRIFISYRREETAYPAGWLYDRLVDRFGGQVFKDVDSIQLGDDFVEVITAAVGSCDVLLALVGDQWLTITDEDGRRRLDDPDDFVRVEIEAALTRNVRVIPILVDGARMPRAEELPPSLARLVRRQALELSPARFEYDTGRLLTVLDRTLAEVRAAHEDAAPTKAPIGKATDPSTTEPPPAPDRRDQAERNPTPSVPLAAPVTPPEARPASDLGKPLDKQRRRLSKRAQILAGAGAGAGVALILLIVAIVADNPVDYPASGEYTNGAYRISGSDAAALPGDDIFGEIVDSKTFIFQDDFSNPESGWHVASEAGVDTSVPPNLRIAVEGSRAPSSDQNMNYGILCRVNGDQAYLFVISDNYAKIVKLPDYETFVEVDILREFDTPVNPDAKNRLQAECTSDEGEEAVRLVFSVNGVEVADEKDTENPLPPGTVGLYIETSKEAEIAGVAEFDNFVVTQL